MVDASSRPLPASGPAAPNERRRRPRRERPLNFHDRRRRAFVHSFTRLFLLAAAAQQSVRAQTVSAVLLTKTRASENGGAKLLRCRKRRRRSAAVGQVERFGPHFSRPLQADQLSLLLPVQSVNVINQFRRFRIGAQLHTLVFTFCLSVRPSVHPSNRHLFLVSKRLHTSNGFNQSF